MEALQTKVKACEQLATRVEECECQLYTLHELVSSVDDAVGGVHTPATAPVATPRTAAETPEEPQEVGDSQLPSQEIALVEEPLEPGENREPAQTP